MVAFVAILAICGTCVQAYASGETDDNVVISWIDASNLPRNNIIFYIFRHIGWAIICGMRFLVNGFQMVVFTVAKNMGNLFYGGSDPSDSSQWGKGVFSSQTQSLVIVFMALIGLAILGVGILYLVKPQKVGTVAKNIVIGLLVAVSLPVLVGGAFSLTYQLTQLIPGSDEKIGNQIIMNGTYDMLKLDSADLLNQLQRGTDDTNSTLNQWKANPDAAPVDLRPSVGAYGSDYELTHIDPTEMVGLRGIFDNGVTVEDKFWNNTVVKGSDGEEKLQALNDGRIGNDGTSGNILSGQYYRWDFNWIGIIVPLFVMTFVLGLCGIKLVRLLFEMIVKQLLAQILAFIDLHTMQRLKKCLYSIVSSCATFFGTFLMLQLYILAQRAIGTWTNGLNSGWTVLGQVIIQIALGWAVIDGPDIFEKLFGMDIGIKSAAGTLYGLQTVGRAAKAGFNGVFGTRTMDGTRVGGLFGRRGVVDTATNAASYAVAGISGAFGFLRGMADGNRTAGNNTGGNSNPAAAGAQRDSTNTNAPSTQGAGANQNSDGARRRSTYIPDKSPSSGKRMPHAPGPMAGENTASGANDRLGPVPQSGFENKSGKGALEYEQSQKASDVSAAAQRAVRSNHWAEKAAAIQTQAAQALAARGITAPPWQNPSQKGFAGAAHAAAQAAINRGGAPMRLPSPMPGAAARGLLSPLMGTASRGLPSSGTSATGTSAPGAIPPGSIPTRSGASIGMDAVSPDSGGFPMPDSTAGGDESGWAQDEYANEQWQEVYDQRGYGETAGEYLRRRLSNYAQRSDNRFTRPVRTAKRAYDLGRNMAIKRAIKRNQKSLGR
jgi:hypothetical protein